MLSFKQLFGCRRVVIPEPQDHNKLQLEIEELNQQIDDLYNQLEEQQRVLKQVTQKDTLLEKYKRLNTNMQAKLQEHNKRLRQERKVTTNKMPVDATIQTLVSSNKQVDMVQQYIQSQSINHPTYCNIVLRGIASVYREQLRDRVALLANSPLLRSNTTDILKLNTKINILSSVIHCKYCQQGDKCTQAVNLLGMLKNQQLGTILSYVVDNKDSDDSSQTTDLDYQ